MIDYEIMIIHGLVVNERLKSRVIIPKENQILKWITEEII